MINLITFKSENEGKYDFEEITSSINNFLEDSDLCSDNVVHIEFLKSSSEDGGFILEAKVFLDLD